MNRHNRIRRAVFTSFATMALIGAQGALAQDNEKAEATPDSVSDQASVPSVVSAIDPQSVFLTVKGEGYTDVELVLRGDQSDETFVRFRNEGLSSRIAFRDCDEAVPDFCQTLTLVTGWDRETPMSAEAVARANREFRYISVYLDDEGDPYAQWAVITGREGIPAPVFLNTLTRYVEVVNDYWGSVFDDDTVEESAAEEEPLAAGDISEADPAPEPNP